MKHIVFSENADKKTGFTFLCIINALAIVTGSFTYSDNLFQKAFTLYISKNGFQVLNDILSLCIFMVLYFLCGLSAVGQTFSVFVLFIEGIKTGAEMSELYKNISDNFVLAKQLVCIIPKTVVILFISVIAVRESIISSNEIFRCISRNEVSDKRNSLKLYCLRFIILFVFSLLILVIFHFIEVLFQK